MLYNLRLSSRADPAFADTVTDLLQSTSRTLMLAIGGIYILWTLAVTVFLFQRPVGLLAWRIMPIIVLVLPVALWLLPRSLVAAQAVWQLALATTITLAIYVFRQPEIAFFYALLPLIAIVTVNWVAGCLMEGIIGALMWWLAPGPMGELFPRGYVLAVISAGAITLALGWIITEALLTVTHWSLFSLDQARKNMEEARQHRAQLLRTQKNLDCALYQLDRANAALVAAWRAAEEATRFKTEFVNTISHELRTPLNLIAGFSEMMMTSPESYGAAALPPAYRGDINSIYRSAWHLLALVDDILDLGRIEAGKLSLVREKLDMASVVTEAMDMVHDYIVAKGLELHMRVADDLPPIWGDCLRIRQVLLNLLVNASRFTERGWIEVVVERCDLAVVVRVTDTGRGIREQGLPHVFEEFRSSDQAPATWHSGTGLGLPISKKYVELHGGEIGVESVYGEGTTFWFTLPVSWEPVTDQKASGASRSLPIVRLRSSQPIIVVTHEDPNVPHALGRFLTSYQVIGAETVAEGLARAEEVKAIAVVTESGQSLNGATASLPKGCLLATCPLPSSRWAALMLGVEEVLTKPVSRERLLAAIDRLEREVASVLITDDNPDVVELFKRMLSNHLSIKTCLHAYNGEDALHIARTEPPDLILLDLVMPGLDGKAVLRHMAADPDLAGIPVIVVSAEMQSQMNPGVAGSIEIAKAGQFQMGEIVRTLEAIFTALAPEWHRLGTTVSGSATKPPGSPAWASTPLPPSSAPVEVR